MALASCSAAWLTLCCCCSSATMSSFLLVLLVAHKPILDTCSKQRIPQIDYFYANRKTPVPLCMETNSFTP
jgi:hypothetical protein